jgi:MFS family permease
MSDKPPGKTPASGKIPVSTPPPRAIRLFLLQRFAGGMAMQMQAVAVGWYVYALTSSPLDLGFIGLVQFLPLAGLALVTGHVIDRYPRRLVLLAAQTAELACYLALAAVAYEGVNSAGLVFIIVGMLGVARAFDSPTQAALLPGLVHPRNFPRAAAWSSMAIQAAVVLGPAAGGLIYILGEYVPFAAAAALAAIGLLAVLGIEERRAADARAPVTWKTLVSGVAFIRHHQAVLGAISLDLFGVLFGGATALLPIFARDILTIGPVGLGLMRSAPAAGAMVTGLILARRPLSRHIGARMLIAVGIFGLATLVFGVSRWTPLSFAALVCIGASDMVSVVTRNTLVQTETPDAIRGRVSAVNSVFIGTSNQLGEFESGLTASWFGPVGSVVLGGAATVLIAGLWAWKLPALRQMDRFNTARR